MNKLRGIMVLGGRLLLTLIFLMSGVHKILDWEGTAAYIASKEIPLLPVPVLQGCAIGFELLGGLMILFGFFARIGAWLLIVFLVMATVLFHNFWSVDPAASPEAHALHEAEMINFLKNLSILGGVLLVAALGAGPMAVDNIRHRRS